MNYRRARAALFFIAASGVGGASCSEEPRVDIVLIDSCDKLGTSFKALARFTEITVFRDGCPDNAQIRSGFAEGVAFHVIVPVDQPLPEIGNLAQKSFGFAALLRDADCRVIGFGCTQADLSVIREVRIGIKAWGSSNVCEPLHDGGCSPPLACVGGACAATDAGDASVLDAAIDGDAADADKCPQLLAAGYLPPSLIATANLTGPALAATDNGFLIAYREQDTIVGALRASAMTISDQGVPGKLETTSLPPCASITPSDGVGLAFAKQAGLVAVSLPNCADAGAGATFIPIDEQAVFGTAASAQNATFAELALAPLHSLAPTPTSNEWGFVYRRVSDTTQAELALLEGNHFKTGTGATSLFGGKVTDFVMVANGAAIRAVLARVSAESKLLLDIGAPGETPKSELTLPDALWASVSANGNRAIAVAPTVQGLAWIVADSSGVALAQNGFSTESYVAGDVALSDTRAFIVGTVPGGFTLHRLDALEADAGAPMRFNFKDLIGTVDLSSFDGSHVALVTARDRVALAWLSRHALAQGTPTGGWALFQCTP